MRNQKIKQGVPPEVKRRQRKCRAARLSRKRTCELLGDVCSSSRILAGVFVCIAVQPCRKIKDLKTCPAGKR